MAYMIFCCYQKVAFTVIDQTIYAGVRDIYPQLLNGWSARSFVVFSLEFRPSSRHSSRQTIDIISFYRFFKAFLQAKVFGYLANLEFRSSSRHLSTQGGDLQAFLQEKNWDLFLAWIQVRF